MKLNLALIFSLITLVNFAQNFSQNNEPLNGESLTLFVCDPSFSNNDDNKGTGVVWDFSTVTSDAGNTSKTLSIQANSNSNFASTKVTSIPSFLETYWSSDVNTKKSQGFVYYTNDNSIGNFDIRFNTNEEKILDYPSSYGATQTDTYSGTFINNLYAAGGSPCSGSITSIIDGSGTLILPGNNSFTNVLRHKVTESTTSSITLAPFGLVNVTVNRVQYDYYDLATSTLPLFTHIDISYDAGGIITDQIVLVLSSIAPGTIPSTASIPEIVSQKLNVFPNPIKNVFKISGDIQIGSTLQIIDPNGREVMGLQRIDNTTEIDVSSLISGVYFVNVFNGEDRYVIRIVVE